MTKNEGEIIKMPEDNLLDLLINDLSIDREIHKLSSENISAAQKWLAGIQDIRVREIFRLFLEDSKGVVGKMASQRVLMLKTLKEWKNQWETQNITSQQPILSPQKPPEALQEPSGTLPGQLDTPKPMEALPEPQNAQNKLPETFSATLEPLSGVQTTQSLTEFLPAQPQPGPALSAEELK